MDTPEYKTLIENYPDYYTRCLQVGPSAIAVELRPSGILSDNVYHYLDNPHHDRDEKARKLLSAIVVQAEIDPVSLTTFTEALESAELKLRFRNLIVTAIVLNVALLLLYMQFEGSAYKNTLVRFAEKLNSTYMNPATTSSKTLLNSIEYEGVKLQLPFIIPKVRGKKFLSTDDPQVDEVINRIKPGSRVLFTGRPGVGKTALTKYMALKWAKGELLTHCILTLQVPLMSTIPNVHTLLDEVLLYYSESHLVEQEIISSEGRGVCLIFDALDEYTPAESGKGDLVYSVIRGEFLQQATVLVTSRISANTNELEEVFNMRYNLTGFSRSDIDLYVAKLPTKLQQDITTVFNVNYNVWRMCYLPLHMTMVVHLASVDRERLSVTDTETVLYTDFLLLTIEQYQKRTGWSAKLAVDCLMDPSAATELCNLLRKISWLAQVALLESTYTLNSTLLDQSQIKTLEQISLFGLEIERGRHGYVYYYSFAHPTFQEYLAAFYISQLPGNLAVEALERHYELVRYKNVWIYYFGIVGNYNKKLDNKNFIMIAYLTKLYNIVIVREQQFKVANNIAEKQLQRCKLWLDYHGILFTELAYEAKITSSLQQFMYETNFTGPVCEYELSIPIFNAHDCLYLSHILNYVSIHSLVLDFHYLRNELRSCQMVFLKELKVHNNQITSVVNLTVTVNGMEFKDSQFIVGPIIELATSLKHLNLKCSFVDTPEKRLSSCNLESLYDVNTIWHGDHSTLETLKTTDCELISIEEISKVIPHLTNLRSLSVLLSIVNLDITVLEFAKSLSNAQTLTSLDIRFEIDYDVISEVSEYTSLEIGRSIKQLKHLKSLSIDCNCIYYSEDGAECYCANIISISAGYLTNLKNLKLSRHVFKMSDALQLKASLSSLMQLTHLTLDINMYEEGAERTILSSVSQIENLIVYGRCWPCDRFVYEAVYSLQSILLCQESTVDDFETGEPNLTYLADALRKTDKLQYLEIVVSSIEAIDIYTAVTSHSSLHSHQIAVNPFRKIDSTMLWKEIRRT